MFRAALKVILGITLAGTLASLASAEMIYHRGNTAEPDTLDPSKASTTYEANILRDLFEGLVMPDAKANIMPGVGGELADFGRPDRLHVQASRGRGVVKRRSRHS